MRRGLTDAVSAQMLDMPENWQVPTERVLSWFPKSRRPNSYGVWFVELLRHEILFAYYEMLKLGEGLQAAQVEDWATAHPLRVAQLSKHLRRRGTDSAEICGLTLTGVELEILLLSAGKLSVLEISRRVSKPVADVTSVLKRLERKHLIVYALH